METMKDFVIITNEQLKWDDRFLSLAAEISTYSKDPSTQVGAVIVDAARRIVSTGFNGFPRGIDDDPTQLNDRDLKYRMIIHAELNAILFAQRDLSGCTIYTYPMPPCAQCAAAIIQSGIKRVVSIDPTPAQRERWGGDWQIANAMYQQAGVEVVL
ncbi:dCMP deaminase family protein [Chromatium okenii]|uniref:deoxycytidylate deaminase n=1 Tax=Chromatium okenii TaxID=61644 RepID=UPI0026E940E4|nr:dCMP deaminase family protein [Chromatium okenii]